MSHHRQEPIQFDKKTKITTTVGLQWTILAAIVGSAVWGTMKLDEIETKINQSVSIEQQQEWLDRFRESNKGQIIVPSLPRKSEPVGQRKRNLAEVP